MNRLTEALRMLTAPKKVKIVFLDIDGVLNNDNYAAYCLEQEGYDPFMDDKLDPRNLAHLQYLIKETGAEIVCSSSWRWERPSFNAFKDQLKQFNLECKDTTLKDIRTNMSRSDEIKDYLTNHPEIDNYVIIDDTEITDTELAQHWVQTVFKFGLTKNDAEKAIEKLRSVNR